MRPKRKILVASAALAGAVVIAAAVGLSPPVQTRLARKALASIAGPGASLEGASGGWGQIALTGLRIDAGGVLLIVPSADARLGVLSAYLGRGFAVGSLTARGWTLDLTRPRPAGAAPGGATWAVQAVGAAFRAFNVPAKASLDGVDLEGTIILSDEGGRPMGRARVVVTGGGLAAGSEGRFQCVASAVIDDPGAPVSSLTLTGALTAAMDDTGTFTRADLRMDATASGRQFPNGIGLSGGASAARSAGNVSYSLTLNRGADEITAVDARTNGDPRRVSGAWRLDLKDTDLAPFALGRRLPAFTVAGEGRYDLDAATEDIHALGKLKASASRLEVIARGLGPLGRIDLAADFDIARKGSSLRVDRLETELAGSSPAASVLALQPFEFNTATGELKVVRPSGDLVGISVTGIPPAWLAGALPAVAVEGSDFRGEFALRAEDGRLVLRTKAPLSATGVSVSRAGRPIAAGLDVSAFVLADYASQGWQVQLAPFSVRSAGVKLLTLEARFGRLLGTGDPVKAAGSWSASLPVLTAQPVAARLPKLAAGDASGSFEASLGETRELRVELSLGGLVLASGAAADLPTITGEVRADIGAKGLVTFNAPLRLGYAARTADVVLSGTLASDERGPLFNAALSGAQLSVGDLGVIAGLCGVRVAGEEPDGPAAARATAPFWPGVRGRLSARIDGVAFPSFQLSAVRGALVVGPDSLEVSGGSATFGDQARARFGGKLSFDATSKEPYSLQGALAVENVDSVPFFRSINPDAPPVIEGRFDLTGLLRGSGAGMRGLVDGMRGECRLSSKGGTFRALRTGAIEPLKQAQSKLGDALTTVTALFGKRPDNPIDSIVDLAEGLSEIHYDQMSIRAERGDNLDVKFTEISLLAPEQRITGTGTVTYAAGVSIGGQPLSVDLDLGVRGHTGDVLGALGMLKDGSDDLGYSQLYQPIHLGGTLGDIDQSQWREMLVRAPLRRAGGLFDKLLGR